MDVHVRSKTVHGNETQVAPKVSRVEAREREAVSESRHRRVKVARVKVLVDELSLHGGVHIRPDERDGAARDAAALVRDLDRDVLLALDDDDLDRRDRVLLVVPVALDAGAERVLEQLEADVRQVPRHVRKVQVAWADQLHGRALDHPVVLLADKARVLDRLMDNVMNVLCERACAGHCQAVMDETRNWRGGACGCDADKSLTARVQMIPT